MAKKDFIIRCMIYVLLWVLGGVLFFNDKVKLLIFSLCFIACLKMDALWAKQR